jgi:redox-sensitive bicupin YhaK (pirin superfamily)
LLLHYAKSKFSKRFDLKNAGVGPHPHRGFSPVTFVFNGGVHHRDSRGNSSKVYKNGVQWMNAGHGIIHSERPTENIHELGGKQEIIQLWINSPKKRKMNEPEYYPVNDEQIPRITGFGKGVDLGLIAGYYNELVGPIDAMIPLIAIRFEVKKDSSFNLKLPEGHNAFLFTIDGNVSIKGFGMVEKLNVAQLSKEEVGLEVTALENAKGIIMAAKPINEPLKQYGPFVMNTQTEILEAMRDYQMGKMGYFVERDLD